MSSPSGASISIPLRTISAANSGCLIFAEGRAHRPVHRPIQLAAQRLEPARRLKAPRVAVSGFDHGAPGDFVHHFFAAAAPPLPSRARRAAAWSFSRRRLANKNFFFSASWRTACLGKAEGFFLLRQAQPFARQMLAQTLLTLAFLLQVRRAVRGRKRSPSKIMLRRCKKLRSSDTAPLKITSGLPPRCQRYSAAARFCKMSWRAAIEPAPSAPRPRSLDRAAHRRAMPAWLVGQP